jgi:2-C-methyl-D-erythritol 4-phosphate cytidylyltransferase/2-C-methyl-D-erythritol 2,4-cyclodiphosphate synthase
MEIRNGVLIVAAGRGHRAGGDIPKQYQKIGGVSVLRRTILAFTSHRRVGGPLAVVIHPDDVELYDRATTGLDVLPPIMGGDTRQRSVLYGLQAMAGITPKPENILIHDAARPFVDAKIIERVINALEMEKQEGVLPAVPVTDTLKRVADDGAVVATLKRDGLWRAQTPQGFSFDKILQAHEKAAMQSDNEFTDDASIAEWSGIDVQIVAGDRNNEKITTAEDLQIVDTDNGPRYSRFHTAGGFDVHRLEEGDFVTLCGVQIPHNRSLIGHSDADVGLHALTDALLGCICAADIGEYFPPGDPQWANANSGIFLQTAADKIRSQMAEIIHVDVTLICEQPKVGPYRNAMRQAISELLDIDIQNISVKATTTEGLGYTGRGEAIAAQATATIGYL